MGKRQWDEKHYQVTWEDCEAWAQQLWEEHHVMVRAQVHLEGLGVGLAPVVRVVGSRAQPDGVTVTVFEDYKPFTLRNVGQVEHIALQLLSQALLALDNDKWLAERGQTSLFD